jgi:serine/threonine-protein kinase PknK
VGISYFLNGLGNVAHEQGDYTSARALHEESLALRRELGDNQGIAACLAGLAGVAAEVGEVERGARVLGGVAGLLQNLGAVLDRGDRILCVRAVAAARSLLSEEAFEKAWEQGLGMSMEQAIAYALDDTPEC